jgi:hypothetical protein
MYVSMPLEYKQTDAANPCLLFLELLIDCAINRLCVIVSRTCTPLSHILHILHLSTLCVFRSSPMWYFTDMFEKELRKKNSLGELDVSLLHSTGNLVDWLQLLRNRALPGWGYLDNWITTGFSRSLAINFWSLRREPPRYFERRGVDPLTYWPAGLATAWDLWWGRRHGTVEFRSWVGPGSTDTKQIDAWIHFLGLLVKLEFHPIVHYHYLCRPS